MAMSENEVALLHARVNATIGSNKLDDAEKAHKKVRKLIAKSRAKREVKLDGKYT